MPTPRLLSVLKGERHDPPPSWMMRQAGRYLPEYRELRAEKGGFLDLVYDTDAAAEVTLQPLRRFPFDAAILFSDILIVPFALGQDLKFVAGEGPRLSPTLDTNKLEDLTRHPERLEPIYETVAKVRAGLDEKQTLLGFAGSPWTVATYMVAGQGSKDQAPARKMAYAEPERFAALIEAIADMTVDYLSGQVKAGADAVQLFDSWSGSLSPEQFDKWVIEPNARIVKAFKAIHPDIPVIGFPKGAGEKLPRYAERTGVDAVGVDETIDPEWAHANLPADLPVQGNLDPLLLINGGEALDAGVDRVIAAFKGRPHIFNLGHGIDKTTPIAHVERMISRVRGK
nr:uroporphyrinogen decarboxylase [Sphingomicrobium sediminis]